MNALRWQMAVDRYEDQAPRWAFTLEDADAQLLERRIADGAGLLAAHTRWSASTPTRSQRAAQGIVELGPLAPRAPRSNQVAPTTAGARHPVAAGIAPFAVLDELYEDLDIEADVEVLMTGRQDADPQPLVWTREHGSGRVVVDLLGHDTTSLEDRSHRALSRAAGGPAASEFTGSNREVNAPPG
ncbi:MAG: ThuA domain-containing protein [Microthrixaceae bacterium]